MYVQENNIKQYGHVALEMMALDAICPCWYYTLLDEVESMPVNELVDIINGNYYCSNCGGDEDTSEDIFGNK